MDDFPVISHKLFSYPYLRLAISTKKFGNLSFQHPTISEQKTIQNRKKFFREVGILPEKVVNVALRHSKKIFWVQKKDQGKGSLSKTSLISFYDGLACDQRDVYLMITVADCFPIFFFDPKESCIGIVHAGWRGVLKNIAQEAVKLFQKKKSSNPENIIAFIGPGLQACHYEVKDDVFVPFYNKFGKVVAFKKNGKLWLNLPQVIRNQLLEMGLVKSNIEISPFCTYCKKELFSSFRRDENHYTAQGAIIGLSGNAV